MSLKISVVTVCYNAVDTLEETMLSVLNQTYPNVEYIVIDGGSTDGTVDIIKKYADRLAYWVSEPDKGIYDAMNKGIDIATGDYINFMNAGDMFHSPNVIKSIYENEFHNYKVIYGSTLMKYSYGDYIVAPDKIEKITKCMTLCHQSVFVKLSEARKHLYKFTNGLAADHGALLEIYNEFPESFHEYNGIVSVYDAKDGISSRNAYRAYRDQANLTSSNDSIFRKFRIIIRAYFPKTISVLLGRAYFKFNRRYQRVK